MARTQGSRADITGPLVREAALRLFARHGFAAVSMRQIAREVGVQAGALYAYTPDKQALLHDLMQGHMLRLLGRWQDRPELDPLARLERFVRFHIADSLDHSDAVFLSYMEIRNLSEDNLRDISKLRRSYEESLELILRDGQQVNVMRIADIRLTTMALIAMLTGVTNWYRAGGRLDPDKIGDVYWGLAQGAVGA